MPIDDIEQGFTAKGFGELVAKLQPWFKAMQKGGSRDANAVHLNDGNDELPERSLRVIANAAIPTTDNGIELTVTGALDFEISANTGALSLVGNAGVFMQGATFSSITGAGSVVRADTTGIYNQVATGLAWKVKNHSGATILTTDEATGVTTGIFDGGSP